MKLLRTSVAALSLVALHKPSAAQSERLAFGVKRTPSAMACPDARELAAHVGQLTTKIALDPDVSTDAADRIDVAFSRRGSVHHAEIRATGERAGVRSFSHDGECAPLASAVSVSLAILLDPEWKPPEPPKPAVPEPAPEPEAPRAKEPPTAPRGRAWKAGAFGFAGAAVGLVRSAAPAFGAGLALEPTEALSIGVGAWIVPTQSLELAPGRVDVSLLGAEALACVSPFGVDAFRAFGCLGGLASSVSARGVGYAREGSAARPLLAGEAAVVFRGDVVAPVGWLARAGALVPSSTEAFSIDGAGVAYDPPRVGGLFAAGLSVSIR